MNTVRRAVLDSGVLELGNFTFANGKRANNKLNFDHLFEFKNKNNLSVVLHHMAHVVERFYPEILVGIPRGGEKIAEELAKPKYLGLPIAYLEKPVEEPQPGAKTFIYKSESDELRVEGVAGLVVVEDVFNKFTSTLGALAVPGILERTRAVVGVWDRGNHPSRTSLTVPFEAMVNETVPNTLGEYDELYSFGQRVEQ